MIFMILKTIAYIVVFLAVIVAGFLWLAPAIGGTASGERLERMKASQHHTGERFKNLRNTSVSTISKNNNASNSTNNNTANNNTVGIRSIIDYLFPPKGKNPNQALPSQVFDKTQLVPGSFVWIGHSTLLANIDGLNVITDPVFYNASPLPYTVQPFAFTHPIGVEDLPALDVVLISHDHYDHLDYKAIKQIAPITQHFLVPLGIGAHLERWGVPAEKIQEFDWYQDTQLKGVTFTFAPARHFSGRGLFDRFKTLWGSWIVKSPSLNAYFSGDGGYSDEFKKIGETYGPFDIAFMENGAYNENWAEIHMMPEQTVQATVDLKAKLLFPIHWGKFDLSTHSWYEPVVRAEAASRTHNITMITPEVGQVFRLDSQFEEPWWKRFAS